MDITEKLFNDIINLPEVEAIALGGSRAGNVYDEKSDYDVYVYVTENIPENKRGEIFARYCSVAEIGNHYWETEDNCTLNNGVDIDIIYRSLDEFAAGISRTVDECEATNSYTTCMWHNLLNSKIIFDRSGRLSELQKRYNVPYPKDLRKNIM